MKSIDTAVVLHDTLEAIATKPPTRKGRLSYSFVVSMGYDDICNLRMKGYSFQCILDELIDAGFFDEDADVKHLCQAFSREKKKRLRQFQGAESECSGNCGQKSANL
jgi:hypothetical protein